MALAPAMPASVTSITSRLPVEFVVRRSGARTRAHASTTRSTTTRANLPTGAPPVIKVSPVPMSGPVHFRSGRLPVRSTPGPVDFRSGTLPVRSPSGPVDFQSGPVHFRSRASRLGTRRAASPESEDSEETLSR